MIFANRLQSVVLMLLGLVWIYYAVPLRAAKETAAISDAMQFESDLRIWAEEQSHEEAVGELFDESSGLTLAGESKEGNFREMIRRISGGSAVPKLPGLIAILVGGWGFLRSGGNRPSPTESREVIH